VTSALAPVGLNLAAFEKQLALLSSSVLEAQTAAECVRLANAAEAVLAVVKLGGGLIDDQNRIAIIKLDAEYKAGKLLAKMAKADGGIRWQSRRHRACEITGNGKTTYAAMAAQVGITKTAFTTTAGRTQLIATLPSGRYANEKAKLLAERTLITSRHFIELGRRLRYKSLRRRIARRIRVRPVGASVRVGDFRTVLADVPDNSVGLIFTDPPYDRASVPLFGDLSVFAARVLIDGGSLVCYAPQHALPFVFPFMTPHLVYRWAFAVRHSGGQRRMHGYKVRVAWKPLLWFVKDRYLGTDYLLDLLDSSPGDKGLHDWAQGCGEAAYLIEHLCPEGGLVVDPFCGSGTTLFAAQKLGRRIMGAELDAHRAAVANARLLS
jgi:DNA methylase